jgi:hypothetical protein
LAFSNAAMRRGSVCRICRLACHTRSRARSGSMRCRCLMLVLDAVLLVEDSPHSFPAPDQKHRLGRDSNEPFRHAA